MTSNQPFPFRGASEENLLYGLQKQQQQQQQQNLSNQAMNQYPSLTNQQQYQLQQQSNNNNTMNDLLQIQRHMTGHSSTNSNVRGGRGGSHPGGLSAVAAMATATGNISNYTAGGVTGPGATSTMNTNATILAGAPSSLQQQHQQQQQANHLALSMRYTNPRLGLGAGVSVNPSSTTTTSRGGAPGFASHSQIMESALGALHQPPPQAAGVRTGAGNAATTAALLQNPSRRHSSLVFRLGDLMGPSTTTTAAASTKTTASRIGNNKTGTNTASNISERRSSLELLGEVALDAERRGKKRRHGSEKLPNSLTNASANPIATSTSVLDSNQDSIMMNAILRNSGPSTTTAPTSSSNNNTTTNGPLSELDLVKRKADLEYMLQQNELELKEKRRTSLDLALKQEQQRRNSLELVQRRNSLELAAAVAQRRNSLELAQRRNSLELALQRQRQEQELQRRGSLELALQQQQQQQRRNSLELALQQQQRRSSLELGRRNSLGSVDLTSPRRFSLDHLYPRRNSTDFLRNNDALRSTLLAEQLLGISGGGGVDGRRSSLAMDRRLSNLQMGNNNPIDPNHLDSLFDDGTQTGLALGLRAGETTDPSLLLALRRHSLLQSLNQTNSSNAQTLANQAQFLNTQLAAAAQQQQQLQQASATANTNMNNNNTTNNNDGKYPELMHEQVSPFFLKSFESLQEKMQQSQLSQKNIQSWDKKMGLKRSHSSTMTKTHRSRKQLRELFELQKKVLEQRLGKKKDDKSNNAQKNKPNGFN